MRPRVSRIEATAFLLPCTECIFRISYGPRVTDLVPSTLVCRIASLGLDSPYSVGDLDRQSELGPLLFLGQDVAFLGRCQAALRRHRELVERREFRRFFEPPLDVFRFLQLTELRSDDADHDHLV